MRILYRCLIVMIFMVSIMVAPSVQAAQSKINLDVQSFVLENGMLFLVVERPTTPQVACRIAIRAGSALEKTGKTGIAHLLEHMMFKGTNNFGTKDFKRDKDLQARIEAAYQVVLEEERKREPNRDLIEKKRAEMEDLRRQVQEIYVPQAFSSQLGRNGAVGVNAFTSKDQTQYLASVPSDMLEQWFSIISEQLFEPAWREFYVEKEVVQREWAFRYINNPSGAAWLDLGAVAYAAHPYRNPVIGWKGDMEKYSTKDAVSFHERYYNPTNAVCVLVGDVTVGEARRMAEIYFGRYPSGRRAPEKVTREPPQKGPRKSVRYLEGARTPIVRIGFHGEPMGTKDFYALDAMTMVLSHGRGARMAQHIIQKGLAVDAWAYNPDNRYGGMIVLGGSPNEPEGIAGKEIGEEERRSAYLRACEELEEILIQEVERLKTALISERELRRIKKLNQRDFLDRIRSNEDLAGTLASLEVQIGWTYLLDYLEQVDQVTPGDIMRVAKRFIRADNKTSVYIIPGGTPEKPPEQYTEVRSVSGAAASRLFQPESFENHSTYPTPSGWKHPLSFERKPERIDYQRAATVEIDGVSLFYLPDHELPLIDMTILIKAGSVDLGEDHLGLNMVLNGAVIRGGTERYSPQELAMVLDENAIRVSVSVGREETSVHLSVMKEDWEKGIAILKEIINRPRFDDHVLDVVKRQAMTALSRQGGDAGAVASREGTIWHFKGHPYGRDPLRGLETIPTLTKKELKEFMERHFVTSKMVVAIAGDIEKRRAVQDLRGMIEDMRGKAPERALDDPQATAPVLAFIHKAGQVQSQIRMILPSVKRSHPDYWKLGLLMQVFGGNDSLLYRRLRDDLGLVYATYFYQTYRWRAGMLVGYIGCKGDMTGQAIKETVGIMKTLQKEVPSEELEQKRLDTLNSFVFNVDTPRALVEVYARYYLRGEPMDTLEKIQDIYIGTQKDALQVLAEDFLQPQRLQIFVVGDRNIKVKRADAEEITLEEDLKRLAEALKLPYKELPLR